MSVIPALLDLFVYSRPLNLKLFTLYELFKRQVIVVCSLGICELRLRLFVHCHYTSPLLIPLLLSYSL